MASPMAGCWQLYGKENAEVLADSLMLPSQFKCAMKNVRICEEVHVNGDNVHINIHVPPYSVPAHSKDINFTFGVEHEQSLPFGKQGKGTVQKESDCKWVATMHHDNMTCTITREIRNGEMWVTIGAKDVKTVRKFERCTEACAGAPAQCPKDCASPFQGKWKLYGSDNFDKFMEALAVPAHWRCIFSNMCVCETIHVNGNDVHIKICLPEVCVPKHTHEFSSKFGEPHEMSLPFGHHATACAKKVSETKWQVALTNCPKLGDATLTREIIGEEMWSTLEAKGKKVVYKFVRKGSCGDASAALCPTKKTC